MEIEFQDDLQTLSNALRSETFRFIIISHNRPSIYQDVKEWLNQHFSNQRKIAELSLNGRDSTYIRDTITNLERGILLIPDMDYLFRESSKDQCIYFNQRRDYFARFDIAFICFIQPSSFPKLARKIPDWWSLRSLEIELHRSENNAGGKLQSEQQNNSPRTDSSNLNVEEKEAFVANLLQQLEETEPGNLILLASLNYQIGMFYINIAEYTLSETYTKQALKQYQQIGDWEGEAVTLSNLATTAHAKGDYDTALRYLEQSLEISQQIGDRAGEGRTLNNISQIHDAKGDYDTALRYLKQSLEIQQEIGDRKGEGATLNNLSLIYDAKGDYDTALRYLEQSLEINQQIGDRAGEGATLNNISQIHDAKGDYTTALRLLEQSLEITQQIGDRAGEGTTLNNISQIHYAKGDYDTALRYLEQSLEIIREIGDKKNEGGCLNNISQIHKAKGDYDTALHFLEQSLEIRQQIGDINGKAENLHNMGAIPFENNEFERATPYFIQAYQIFTKIGSPTAKVTEQYLGAIIEKIGEARFQEIVAGLNDGGGDG